MNSFIKSYHDIFAKHKPKIVEQIAFLKQNKCSLIVRTKSEELARRTIIQSIKAGFRLIEVTLTVPNACQIISDLQKQYPEAKFGAGTVLTWDQAEKALQNGAKYLVSPVFSEEILNLANSLDIMYLPGAMTVNEIYNAYTKGAKVIKFYPAMYTTPEYIKVVKNPLPDVEFFVTGNVNLTNIPDYFAAGAMAVGITDKIGNPNPNLTDEQLFELAQQYISTVNKAYENLKK